MWALQRFIREGRVGKCGNYRQHGETCRSPSRYRGGWAEYGQLVIAQVSPAASMRMTKGSCTEPFPMTSLARRSLKVVLRDTATNSPFASCTSMGRPCSWPQYDPTTARVWSPMHPKPCRLLELSTAKCTAMSLHEESQGENSLIGSKYNSGRVDNASRIERVTTRIDSLVGFLRQICQFYFFLFTKDIEQRKVFYTEQRNSVILQRSHKKLCIYFLM